MNSFCKLLVIIFLALISSAISVEGLHRRTRRTSSGKVLHASKVKTYDLKEVAVTEPIYHAVGLNPFVEPDKTDIKTKHGKALDDKVQWFCLDKSACYIYLRGKSAATMFIYKATKAVKLLEINSKNLEEIWNLHDANPQCFKLSWWSPKVQICDVGADKIVDLKIDTNFQHPRYTSTDTEIKKNAACETCTDEEEDKYTTKVNGQEICCSLYDILRYVFGVQGGYDAITTCVAKDKFASLYARTEWKPSEAKIERTSRTDFDFAFTQFVCDEPTIQGQGVDGYYGPSTLDVSDYHKDNWLVDHMHEEMTLCNPKTKLTYQSRLVFKLNAIEMVISKDKEKCKPVHTYVLSDNTVSTILEKR